MNLWIAAGLVIPTAVAMAASGSSAASSAESEWPRTPPRAVADIADEEASGGWGPWVALFDGETLEGWVRRGGRAAYRVEDGCIVGRTAAGEPNTFLCTANSFGDFELRFEFQVDPELNSGVQIRSHSRPEFRGGRVHGYQIEIDPSPRAWTGGLYEEGRRGWLQSPPDEHPARALFRQGEWHGVRVVAEGRRIRTWLEGVPVTDHVDDAPEAESTGFIALQVHGVGPRTDPLEVRWRNLRIRSRTGQAVGVPEAVATPAPPAGPGGRPSATMPPPPDDAPTSPGPTTRP